MNHAHIETFVGPDGWQARVKSGGVVIHVTTAEATEAEALTAAERWCWAHGYETFPF